MDPAVSTESRIGLLAAVAALLAFAQSPLPASAEAAIEEQAEAWTETIVESIREGGVKANVRFRYSHADFEGLKRSNAGTFRARVGYGTRPLYGLSGYLEMEHLSAVDSSGYFDAIAPNRRGRSVIADPENTEINQAFLKFAREDWLGSWLMAGRQRIKYDDDRFIGNVGWRQNEQTYDALRVGSSLGVDGLELQYAYLDDVIRIFGDEGLPGAPTRDFESNSHLARARYVVAPWLKAVAFAYILDLRNAAALSSNSFGTRLTGVVPIAEEWSVAYQTSYAFQTDGGTSGGENPRNYTAHYFLGEIAPRWSELGALGFGYEILGSDNGSIQFTTPLSTAHKFQGFADAFLNNGGPNGLQDFYAFIQPNLPFGVKAKVAFHKFHSHHRTRDLGHEIDFVVSRKFGKYVTLLTKYGYYQGKSGSSPADRVRWTLEANFAI